MHSNPGEIPSDDENSESLTNEERTKNARSSGEPTEREATATLQEVLAQLETDDSPHDEYHCLEPFRRLLHGVRDRGENPSLELVAEGIAFELHAHDHQSPSEWGIYYGPIMSGLTTAGEPWESPPFALITSDVLAYWWKRANETPHPVMRGRYADLLWEIPRTGRVGKPDPVMARVAVDAYIAAVEDRRYESEICSIGKARRALEISLSLQDEARVQRAKEAMLTLEERVAEDDSLGLWGFCFDAFVEPPHKRIALADSERDKLVNDLESRLARFAARPPDLYHPAGAEGAALRLANHYRRIGRKDAVRRVMHDYGDIVIRMHGVASPLLTSHSLEQLYDQFKTFEMHVEADELNEMLRLAGEEALAEMKLVSVEAEIPTEKVESYFAAMLEGPAQQVLLRIAGHFIPDKRESEAQLRDLAEKAPISYLMTHTVKDDEGRTVARIGPLEADTEGQLVRHISQNMHLAVPWLRESVVRGFQNSVFSEKDVLGFLFACPLFQAKRRTLVEAGIKAYTNGDSLAAVHILVPQIEQALRQLAIIIRSPVYAPRRGGGLHVRTLDELLRDEGIAAVLGDNLDTYLRVLLTDVRGWNIRNNVCHGLAPVGMLTMPVADRIVHALLALALLRKKEEEVQE